MPCVRRIGSGGPRARPQWERARGCGPAGIALHAERSGDLRHRERARAACAAYAGTRANARLLRTRRSRGGDVFGRSGSPSRNGGSGLRGSASNPAASDQDGHGRGPWVCGCDASVDGGASPDGGAPNRCIVDPQRRIAGRRVSYRCILTTRYPRLTGDSRRCEVHTPGDCELCRLDPGNRHTGARRV